MDSKNANMQYCTKKTFGIAFIHTEPCMASTDESLVQKQSKNCSTTDLSCKNVAAKQDISSNKRQEDAMPSPESDEPTVSSDSSDLFLMPSLEMWSGPINIDISEAIGYSFPVENFKMSHKEHRISNPFEESDIDVASSHRTERMSKQSFKLPICMNLLGGVVCDKIAFHEALQAERQYTGVSQKKLEPDMLGQGDGAVVRQILPGSSRFMLNLRHAVAQKCKGDPAECARKIKVPVKILPYFDMENALARPKSNHVKSLAQMGFKTIMWEPDSDMIQQLDKKNLYFLLHSMINRCCLPSIMVKMGSVVVSCHLMVLQCYSEYFLELDPTTTFISLPFENVTASSFLMAYEWMLADKPVVQCVGIMHLFNVAHYLRIEALKRQIWVLLDDEYLFSENTAFMLYLTARMYPHEGIKMLMLSRVFKFFLPVVASKDFLELELDEVCDLLNLNTIGVNTEAEILMAAARWLLYKWPQREEHMVRVVSCVRFAALPPWFLISLSRDNHGWGMNKILKNPGVQQLVSDGISVSTLMSMRNNCEVVCKLTLQFMQVKPPHPRKWLYDAQCPYHCPHGFLHRGTINYSLFQEYLRTFQKGDRFRWRNFSAEQLPHSNSSGLLHCEENGSSIYSPAAQFLETIKTTDNGYHLLPRSTTPIVGRLPM